MEAMDWDALEAQVKGCIRRAGTIAVLAEKLGWRTFEDTEDTERLVRVLFEDVPYVIGGEKTMETAWKRISGAAENGADAERVEAAARQLAETAALITEALDDVYRDLCRLEQLAI